MRLSQSCRAISGYPRRSILVFLAFAPGRWTLDLAGRTRGRRGAERLHRDDCDLVGIVSTRRIDLNHLIGNDVADRIVVINQMKQAQGGRKGTNKSLDLLRLDLAFPKLRLIGIGVTPPCMDAAG